MRRCRSARLRKINKDKKCTLDKEEKSCALSDWPSSETSRNEVKIWLEEKNYPDPDDLIGACEPLAYYFSTSISKFDFESFLSLDTLSKQKEFVYSVYTRRIRCARCF